MGVDQVTESQQRVVWRPHEGAQTEFLQCPADEILYGGAVGGGKTDALLGWFLWGAERFGRAWKGVFFRRNYADMDDVIERSMEIFGQLYGERCFNKNDRQWRLPSGAIFQFRSLERDLDVYKYQGQQYTLVEFDELTQWPTPFCYAYMFTRARSAKGVPVLFRSATNPGGPGHSWVKARFVDVAPPRSISRIVTAAGGKEHSHTRCYIPAKLEDNPTLMKNDPGYESRIFQLSDEAYARALRNGDWNIVAGAAFSEWDHRMHVIPTTEVPRDAVCWRSLDWGYDKPYAAGWMFMDPRSDDVILARELYGWGGEPDKGTREGADVVRERIRDKQTYEGINCPEGFLDGATMDKHTSGDSVFDLLCGTGVERMSWKAWPKGPNSRIMQKQLLHSLMKVVNGKSRLKIMDCCTHTIRTLPVLPTSRTNPEDVDTTAEDHAYDMLRGGIAAKKMLTREQRETQDRLVRASIMEQQQRIEQLPYGGF